MNQLRRGHDAGNLSRSTKWLLAGVFIVVAAVGSFCVRWGSDMSSQLQAWGYAIGISLLIAGLLTGVLYTLLTAQQERLAAKSAVFYPLLAGILGFCGISLSYIWLGIWPFGQESAMIVDMHHQYAPMLAELRHMLLHGGNALYTFETGIGANFLSLFAYYLASPFNLLLVVFPEQLLTEGILVITVLKNALAAALFAACIQYVFRRRDLSVVVLALGYSLSMYMIAYSWNIMWLDGVMMLPLVVLGFERMMRTGRYGVYILSLAYTLYTNYYIGFMICVFLVLYYLVFALRQRRTAAVQWHAFLRFAIGSLIGGGLAMGLLIPVFMALRYTSAAGEMLPEIDSNFALFRIMGQQLFGVTPTIRSGNLPNIYCGMLPVLLLPVFLTTKTIPLRRRLAYGGLVAILAASFTINLLDLVWHGFHTPNDLPYRFSFIYVFSLLMVAYMVLPHLREITARQIGGTLALFVAYIAVYEMMLSKNANAFIPVYISLLLVGVYAGILLLCARKKLALRTAYMLLALVMTGEMTLHGGLAMDTLNSNEYFTDHNSYVDNEETAAVRQAMQTLQQKADEETNGAFYRVELLPRRTIVDTALFHYRGLTSFSSSNYYRTTLLLGALGYACNGVNSYMYNSFVPATDSLLGIRYLALNTDVGAHAQLEKIGETRTGDTTYYLYRNRLALPIAYRASSGIHNFAVAQYDPFGTQERLLSALTDNARSVYTYLPVTVSPESAGIANTGSTRININTDDSDVTAWFSADITAEAPYSIYVDCTAADDGTVLVTMPGEQEPVSYTLSMNEPYILDAGVLPAGSTVDISVSTDQSVSGNIYIAALDNTALEEKLTALAAEGMQVTDFSANHIRGTLTAQQNGAVFTSVPYDAGWRVTVDGKQVEAYPIGQLNENGDQGAFLAFDIENGAHQIDLHYTPAGLLPGLCLSAISLVALLMLLYLTRRKHAAPALPPSASAMPQASFEPIPVNDPPHEGLSESVTLDDLMRDPPPSDGDSSRS